MAIEEPSNEIKIAMRDTECEICGNTIRPGETIYPVYDTNANSEGIALEEIMSTWIMDCCVRCHNDMDRQNLNNT